MSRLPLEPSLDDRRHVERILRDYAGIISLAPAESESRRQAIHQLLFWLSDNWLVLREAGYTRESLLEMLQESPLASEETGLGSQGGADRGEADESQGSGPRIEHPGPGDHRDPD